MSGMVVLRKEPVEGATLRLKTRSERGRSLWCRVQGDNEEQATGWVRCAGSSCLACGVGFCFQEWVKEPSRAGCPRLRSVDVSPTRFPSCRSHGLRWDACASGAYWSRAPSLFFLSFARSLKLGAPTALAPEAPVHMHLSCHGGVYCSFTWPSPDCLVIQRAAKHV